MASLTYRQALSILEKDRRSCFHKVNFIKHMILPPRYIENIKKGIIEELNSELRLSSEVFGGALIAYDNIKLLQHVGVIMDEQPYIHFDIQADFIVFKPVIGCNLTGVVNKISSHHIGCLVHSCFNASIPKPYDDSKGWKGSELNIGEEFTFEVTKVYTYNKMLTLRGKFPDVSPLMHQKRKQQPCVLNANSLHNEDITDSEPAGKKRKKHVEICSNQFNGEIVDNKLKKRKKKRKRSRSGDDSENSDSQKHDASDTDKMDVSLNNSMRKRKHKNKKKTGAGDGDEDDFNFSSSQDLFVEDNDNRSTENGITGTNSTPSNPKKKKEKKLKKEKCKQDSDNNNMVKGEVTMLDKRNSDGVLDKSLDTATKKHKKKKGKKKGNETM